MSWVERRAKIQRTLAAKAPEVWAQVRGALQDACDEWRRFYGKPGVKELECEMENGARLRIVRTIYPDQVRVFVQSTETILVMFDKEVPAIAAVRDKGEARISFALSSDEDEVYPTLNGLRCSAEDLSQEILDPLLFRADEKRTPVFPS